MIAFLRGRIAGWDAASAVIDVGGVGYRVMLSTQSLAAITGKDGDITLLTSMITREDSMTLYGFLSAQEQQLFERLITVTGVGPKVALSALSAFNAQTLQQIIVDEDVARVSTIPGIGKKTAQRIILELRGVLDVREPAEADAAVRPPATTQATEALLGMGFTATEVSLALKGYEGDAGDVGALVRFGLKRLGAS
ncbi:MAG: Holliday junction branch migration protein RuvA [Coriobacteriales bacterium]|jgi:Holliday junction DNA helicase RuvA|nr:Holliday junction branch migration protein RuvA [Coriobacteriales bacterium]